MAEKQFKRVVRPATAEERERHATVRRTVAEEFPPVEGAGRPESPPGIPTQIRQAREAQGLTWYALAKLAGIPGTPGLIQPKRRFSIMELLRSQLGGSAVGVLLQPTLPTFRTPLYLMD